MELKTQEAGDDQDIFRHVSRYTVELSSPSAAKRSIAARSPSRGRSGHSPKPRLPGSPYEARIAVLLEETWRGWEGLPFVARLLFTGADLERGFR